MRDSSMISPVGQSDRGCGQGAAAICCVPLGAGAPADGRAVLGVLTWRFGTDPEVQC